MQNQQISNMQHGNAENIFQNFKIANPNSSYLSSTQEPQRMVAATGDRLERGALRTIQQIADNKHEPRENGRAFLKEMASDSANSNMKVSNR